MTPRRFRIFLENGQYEEIAAYFRTFRLFLDEAVQIGLSEPDFEDMKTYLHREIASTFLDSEYLQLVSEAFARSSDK